MGDYLSTVNFDQIFGILQVIIKIIYIKSGTTSYVSWEYVY